jgi:hypothetical protein
MAGTNFKNNNLKITIRRWLILNINKLSRVFFVQFSEIFCYYSVLEPVIFVTF